MIAANGLRSSCPISARKSLFRALASVAAVDDCQSCHAKRKLGEYLDDAFIFVKGAVHSMTQTSTIGVRGPQR